MSIPLNKLREGYESAIENAERLLNDSKILYQHKCLASSIQLSLLSSEEAGKAFGIIAYMSQGKSITKKEWEDFRKFRGHWKKLFWASEAAHMSFDKMLREAVVNNSSLERFLGIKPHEPTVKWKAEKLKQLMIYLDYDFKNNKWLRPGDSWYATASSANGFISEAEAFIKAVRQHTP